MLAHNQMTIHPSGKKFRWDLQKYLLYVSIYDYTCSLPYEQYFSSVLESVTSKNLRQVPNALLNEGTILILILILILLFCIFLLYLSETTTLIILNMELICVWLL